MNKRIFKSILLIIILGVPVFWYLFLQLFGENQFELQPIRDFQSDCFKNSVSIIVTQSPEGIDEENQLDRLVNKVDNRQVRVLVDSLNCIPDSSAEKLYLIDGTQLRGAYLLTIDEVDRLLVEQDLLLTLLDGATNTTK